MFVVWDIDRARPLGAKPRPFSRAARIADVLEQRFGRNFMVTGA